MIRSDDLKDFLATQSLLPETVAGIEERLRKVELEGGSHKGKFSDCDTDWILGSDDLSRLFEEYQPNPQT